MLRLVGEEVPMIEKIPFGRTGHHSTRMIFGAASLGAMRQDRADRVLEQVVTSGVNHIDTAARYGESELRLAPLLRSSRDSFFVATKTGERSYAGAREGIRRSLDRLGVDRVDLIQFHHLVDEAGHAELFSEQGALRAAVEAKQEGLVRFIGVTGHGTRAAAMHLRSLELFDFDSVLLPYNFVLMSDPDYAADFEALMAVCAERKVAVQTIKSVARRRWQGDEQRRFSWYEPIKDPDALARAVRWVLARPGIFLNTSSDATLLQTVLTTASDMGEGPTDIQMRADIESLRIEPLFIRGVAEEV